MYGEKAQQAAQEFKPFVEKSIKEQPMSTLAAAAAIGFVLGAIWKKYSPKSDPCWTSRNLAMVDVLHAWRTTPPPVIVALGARSVVRLGCFVLGWRSKDQTQTLSRAVR